MAWLFSTMVGSVCYCFSCLCRSACFFFFSRVLQQGQEDGERLMAVLFQTLERERGGWGYCSSLLSFLIPPFCLPLFFFHFLYFLKTTPLFFSSRFSSFYIVSLLKFSLKSLPSNLQFIPLYLKKKTPLFVQFSLIFIGNRGRGSPYPVRVQGMVSEVWVS